MNNQSSQLHNDKACQVNSTERREALARLAGHTDLDSHFGRDAGQATAPDGEVGVGRERRLQAGKQRHDQLLVPWV